MVDITFQYGPIPLKVVLQVCLESDKAKTLHGTKTLF